MAHLSSTLDDKTLVAADTRAAARPKSRARVDYIEYFRGVAILLIIAGHAFDLAWTRAGQEHSLDSVSVLSTLSALLTGGTFYFVFISGFLYRHVFYERMAYGDFMWKKAVQVGAPYLVLGSLLALLQMYSSGFHVTIFKDGAVLGENRYVDFAVLMTTGQMMTAYWYIPFIFVVFLASPLFDRYIRLSLAWKVAILIMSLMVAFWVHRPYESLDPFHSFVYFTNIYLFGILFCEHREAWIAYLKRPTVLLMLAIAVLTVALAENILLHKVGDLERTAADGWLPLGFDLMILQKYLGILFFCGALARWGQFLGRPLTYLAEVSFGLYFMHGVVLTAINHAPDYLSPHMGTSILDFVTYSVMAILGSLAIVMLVKRATGRYSRYVIGA